MLPPDLLKGGMVDLVQCKLLAQSAARFEQLQCRCRCRRQLLRAAKSCALMLRKKLRSGEMEKAAVGAAWARTAQMRRTGVVMEQPRWRNLFKL